MQTKNTNANRSSAETKPVAQRAASRLCPTSLPLPPTLMSRTLQGTSTAAVGALAFPVTPSVQQVLKSCCDDVSQHGSREVAKALRWVEPAFNAASASEARSIISAMDSLAQEEEEGDEDSNFSVAMSTKIPLSLTHGADAGFVMALSNHVLPAAAVAGPDALLMFVLSTHHSLSHKALRIRRKLSDRRTTDPKRRVTLSCKQRAVAVKLHCLAAIITHLDSGFLPYFVEQTHSITHPYIRVAQHQLVRYRAQKAAKALAAVARAEVDDTEAAATVPGKAQKPPPKRAPSRAQVLDPENDDVDLAAFATALRRRVAPRAQIAPSNAPRRAAAVKQQPKPPQRTTRRPAAPRPKRAPVRRRRRGHTSSDDDDSTSSSEEDSSSSDETTSDESSSESSSSESEGEAPKQRRRRR